LQVAARGAHVIARPRGLEDLDVVAVGARHLDHHDRVGALRNGRTRHDANRFARTDSTRRCLPRGQLVHDA
jgi:hypothetical protein